MSGCMGDAKPDFLFQLYRSMIGNDEQKSKGTDWGDLLSPTRAKGNEPRIGLVRCMWPSGDLAQTMTLRSVCSGRAISKQYWYT
mmetsp:Transcript_20615/g.37252  ORF Transcript_20615/g.37252 Transcript_20615/m.37252 type:complete len:84 (-) Transcript_20615:621-872(-)